MSVVSETVTRTLCDRCARECRKGSGRVVLTSDGMRLVATSTGSAEMSIDHGHGQGEQVRVSVDLCKACVESLHNWWANRRSTARGING